MEAIDCAFKKLDDAKAYAEALNSNPAKAVAHCKEVIALRLGEAMVKFLNEENGAEFEVVAAELNRGVIKEADRLSGQLSLFLWGWG